MTCDHCNFFQETNDSCRRFPPQVVIGRVNGNFETRWPVVLPSDWCGEFVERHSPTAPRDGWEERYE